MPIGDRRLLEKWIRIEKTSCGPEYHSTVSIHISFSGSEFPYLYTISLAVPNPELKSPTTNL